MIRHLRPWSEVAAVALLVWLGIHSVRAYLAMVGWVLGTGLSTGSLGVLLLSIWGLGQFGRPVALTLGGDRPELRLGAIFGLLYVLYRAWPGALTGPLFGCLALAAWLWLLPTTFRAIGLRGGGDRILPGVLLGLAGQVGLQAALHGLDLVHWQGPAATAGALVLVGALLLALRRSTATGTEATGAAASGAKTSGVAGGPLAAPGWGLAALGPYLVLQLTLTANLGWVGWLSGWDLTRCALFIIAGLALGAFTAGWRTGPITRLLLAGLAVALLLEPRLLQGAGVWLLLPLQALLPPVLAAGLAVWSGRQPDRTYLWTALGFFLFIALLLLFYLFYEGKVLWPLMAGLALLPGAITTARPTALAGDARRGPSAATPARSVAGAIALVGLVAAALSLLPYRQAAPLAGPAPAELKVLTYNIHQLFDQRGLPAPTAIARVIEMTNADLIGLQEVGRGWNFLGGADLVAWLRWRFPDYQVLYGKTEGDLVGNLLLSRYQVAAWGWELFAMQGAPLQRGFIWARLPTTGGDLLFVNTHLSAFAREEADRLHQVATLLNRWNGQPRFLLAGDLNAGPDSLPMRTLAQGGLIDLPAALGLGAQPTFPAGRPGRRLDYIWGSDEVEPLAAKVIRSTASDHLPVLVQVRVR